MDIEPSTKFQNDLANRAREHVHQLDAELRRSFRRVHGSQQLSWSCILASDLPWS
jgi:hypothetical protein